MRDAPSLESEKTGTTLALNLVNLTIFKKYDLYLVGNLEVLRFQKYIG